MKYKCKICDIMIEIKPRLDANTGEPIPTIEDRLIDLAHFFLNHQAVCRQALKQLGVWEEME